MPRIDFVAEADQCPQCGDEPMKVQKSKSRTVITLAEGAFTAREISKYCDKKGCVAAGSEALRRVVKPGQRYGYDLIVHVGLARYLRGKQRGEIRHELLEHRGIELSAGTVSALCDRFLMALETLHLLRSPYMRAAMQGGYPLHLDATCDRGKGGVLAIMDGWRGWVLMAGRIDSERVEHFRPLVDKTVGLFGDPIAIVRDLGKAGAGAVAHLREQDIPDLLCHYHLLAAVGKNLCDKPYASLKHLVRGSHLRSDLRALLRGLRRYRTSESHEGRFGPGHVREELLALILWLLEGSGTKDATYPFALPHLGLVRRCLDALPRADDWVPCPRSRPERRALRHLESLVVRINRDTRFDTMTQQLDRAFEAFGELRDVLRLNCAESPGGDEHKGDAVVPAFELRRLQQIEQAVDEYKAELRQRVAPLNKREGKACPDAVILRYLDRYGDGLFGHPVRRDDDGSVLAIVARTNNVLEQFFGKGKQQLRRRVGRANLGQDLEQQPPQVMLVANLEHPEYVRVLCGSLANLPAAFAGLDAQLTESDRLQRNNRDWALIRRVRELLEGHEPTNNGPEATSNRLSATEF